MFRRLFTVLSALSLLLFVATVVLWVRSYWTEESIAKAGPRGFWEVDVSRGVFHFYRERVTDPAASYEDHEVLNPFGLRRESRSPQGDRGDLLAGKNRQGYDLQLGSLRAAFHDGSADPWPAKVNVVTCPCWLVALLLLVLPARFAIVGRRGRRRLPAGLCPACGYDLRATPGRCPECGTAAAGKQA